MHTWLRCTSRLIALSVASVTLVATTAASQNRLRVASPNGRNQVTVEIREGGLYYSIDRDGRVPFPGTPPLRDSLRITDTATTTHDETWTQPWGEVARVRDHHNELKVSVAE